MQEYIDKLYQEMHEIAAKPVTLGRAEEISVYAEAICAVERLRGKTRAGSKIDQNEATGWAERMVNADGSTGPHWAVEQTDAIANNHGIRWEDTSRWAWYAAINMLYSDYCQVATEYGLNRPDFYATLAKAFLMDPDGPGPEEKIKRYHMMVAKD